MMATRRRLSTGASVRARSTTHLFDLDRITIGLHQRQVGMFVLVDQPARALIMPQHGARSGLRQRSLADGRRADKQV